MSAPNDGMKPGGRPENVTVPPGLSQDKTLTEAPGSIAPTRVFVRRHAWATRAFRWVNFFFFAWVFMLNGFAYAADSLLSGHLRRELKHIGATVTGHARLR